MNDIDKFYEEMKKHIDSNKKKENLNFSYDEESKNIDLGRLPNSIEEAVNYSNFWQSIFNKYSELISEMEFSYQEKTKEIPLTKIEKIKYYLGFEIEEKKIEGEVKTKTVHPLLIQNEKGLAKIISNKEEWKELNSLSKTTNDIYSSFILSLEPLCYKTRVPLELVTRIKFREIKK